MISDLSMLFVLKLALEATVTGWPNVTQGDNTVTANLKGVDLAVWDNAYIAKVPVAGGATVTVNLRDFETLVGEENVAFDKVFGIVVQVALAVVDETDAQLSIVPGAADPLQWFFTADDEGLTVDPGATFVHMEGVDSAGYNVDGTHKNLDLTNAGADDLVATVIILGGT